MNFAPETVTDTKPPGLRDTVDVTYTESAEAPELAVSVIEPGSGWQMVSFAEVWHSRELLSRLTLRDIRVRYKQTLLGLGWALVQPLATMLVFVVFLGRMGGMNAGVENYPLFVFAAILPWTFFSNALTLSGLSLIQNQNLVTKVWFPRVLVPFSAIGAALFDFLMGAIFLGGMMLYYGVVPGINLLALPLVMGLLLLASAGLGMLLSALIVVQRDLRHVLTFGIQIWMFATPCIYLSHQVMGELSRELIPLNPAYGLVLNFRNSVMNLPMDWYSLGISGLVSAALFLVGSTVFRRVERRFADVI